MDKMFIRFLVLVLVVTASVSSLKAQTGYMCDFEDLNENLLWQLNLGYLGQDCKNKWYIGEAVNNGGSRSLYVSGDGGENAGYTNAPTSVSCSRTLNLPKGSYILSFDWQALGYNGQDALYVCWMPESEPSNSNNGNSKVPIYVEKYGLSVYQDSTKMCNSTWNSVFDTIVSDGVTPYKLVYVWNNKVLSAVSPGACIDNIEIFPLNDCIPPYGIEVKPGDNDVEVLWNGAADSYDMRCKFSGDKKWKYFNGCKDSGVVVDGFGEGIYDVYVRSRCGSECSPWVSHNQFIFFRGARCIDYMDLENSGCFTGILPSYPTEQTVWQAEMVDSGYKNVSSRHTIHYSHLERDDRTLGMLQTVPDGELASVRLGNWNVNNGTEKVEYEYLVDTAENAILLLKYAVVMQDPGHKLESQPRFTLEVLKDNDEPLDSYGCAEADFSAGENTSSEEGWHQTPGDPNLEPPLWKEWSTVGINLKDYHNQNLKIRLTTFDCRETGHYGYAYFALGCSDGKIESLSCGNSEKNMFRAPDGFNYRWYLPDKPGITLSTDQCFETYKTDTLTYCCDVINPVKDKCYYTIKAVATPRYPVAHGAYAVKEESCQNVVYFTDSSYVRHINPVTGEVTVADLAPDSIIWDFGDGSPVSRELSPRHIYPKSGGRFTVVLSAYLAAECIDTKMFELDIPDLPDSKEHITAYACKGFPYTYRSNNFYSDTLYTDTVRGVSGCGCDSIYILDLKFGQNYTVDIFDTICHDKLPYTREGDNIEYWKSGFYIDTFKTNVFECDSIVRLNLTVLDALTLDIDHDGIETCGDSIVIPFTVHTGLPDYYSLTFQDETVDSQIRVSHGEISGNAIMLERPASLKPGSYKGEAVFANADCGDVTKPLTLEVYYPDSVIAQRWNDVLGVKNSMFNGGYDFTEFQWYKNGQPIEGQVTSILYNGENLDFAASYSVLLGLSDGTTQFTCPFTPMEISNIRVMPTVVFPGDAITVQGVEQAVVRVWSVTGLLVDSKRVSYADLSLKAPTDAGIYIVEVITADGISRSEKVVVVDYR